MNREAAVLGTPVWSIFEGKLGAVDEQLAREGRLRFLEGSRAAHRRAQAVRARTRIGSGATRVRFCVLLSRGSRRR